MEYQIITGTSKKGNPYKALKIMVGDYSTVIFPSKIEMLYIEKMLEKAAKEND